MIHSVPVAPKDEEHTVADEDKRTTKEKEQSERINEIAHEKRRYLSQGRPAEARASLRISAVSPEPSLFANMFVCVEVLRPSQPNGVMSSAVSLPNHTFTGQA